MQRNKKKIMKKGQCTCDLHTNTSGCVYFGESESAMRQKSDWAQALRFKLPRIPAKFERRPL